VTFRADPDACEARSVKSRSGHRKRASTCSAPGAIPHTQAGPAVGLSAMARSTSIVSPLPLLTSFRASDTRGAFRMHMTAGLHLRRCQCRAGHSSDSKSKQHQEISPGPSYPMALTTMHREASPDPTISSKAKTRTAGPCPALHAPPPPRRSRTSALPRPDESGGHPRKLHQQATPGSSRDKPGVGDDDSVSAPEAKPARASLVLDDGRPSKDVRFC
jgi:hypothetical protein